ncbi:phosphodiester glycosidase family protein [Lyngbya sp. PCC 8106]|uniref:phosphodiester glycosidase family protein n=1 Tax=Lyngbya sp. (strain PCC 8106) TaxID=313612 RepID=UPI000A05FF7D|nr:phosphodiester glycosidase family protein [Lyngbya sp. PCC 8106]
MFQSFWRLTQYIAICTVLSVLFGFENSSSQASQSPLKIIRQGSLIELNNQEVDLAWVQWQSTEAQPLRVGIRDLGLMRLLGLDLLNTNDSAQQPVEWFSSADSSPLTLFAFYHSPNRYLDVTAFAQKGQWDLSVVGTRLKIVTPPATIKAIQQHPLSPSTNLPISPELLAAYRTLQIELDQRVLWEHPQIAPQPATVTSKPLPDDPNSPSSPALTPWMIRLAAQLDPAAIAPFSSLSERPLDGLEQVSDRHQTTLTFNVPVGWRPVVSTFSDPHRLLIDIRPDFLVERNILWMPGLRWRQQYIEIPNSQPTASSLPNRFPVFWLEIDLTAPQLSLKPILSRNTSRVGLAPLLKTASRSQALAAINGGFFNRNTLFPLGAIRRQGRWLSSPILNRGAIGWTDQGEIYLDRLTRFETLITATGNRFPIQHLNSGYVEAGISRYTSDWGSTYFPVLDREWAMITRNHRIIEHLFRERPIKLPVPILDDDYLLVVRNHKEKVTQLPIGTEVKIESQTDPPIWETYPQILAAGPLLLQSGEIVLDAPSERFSEAFSNQQAIRSAVGRTPDNKLLLVAVHNRPLGSGPNLTELAQILQKLGAVEALNLDGGSSTSLYLGGELIDRPAQTAAPIHNGLGVFGQPEI